MNIFKNLFFIYFTVVSFCSAEYIPQSGPVYINPNAAASQILESQSQSDSNGRITQTVYGFLDFTTTIGNTVMVFSPQSAAPIVEAKSEKQEISVIETKASKPTDSEIKPNKTLKPDSQTNISNEKQGQISSGVHVAENNPTPTKVAGSKAETSILSSKVEIKEGEPIKMKKNAKQPIVKVEVRDENNQIVSSKIEIRPQDSILSSVVKVIESESPVTHVESSGVKTESNHGSEEKKEEPAIEVDTNNIDKPEYDFLHRQPSEVVDETYKVIDLKPNNNKAQGKSKPRNSERSHKEGKKDRHTTGLVTKYGGTIVKDGATTVHETQVLGTYISGKYAQVLQSTSRVVGKPKISPTQTARILKTAAPNLSKSRAHLEPTPAGSLQEETALPLEALFQGDKSVNLIRPSRRPGPAVGGPSSGKGDFKNKGRSRSSTKEQDFTEEYDQEEQDYHTYKKSRSRNSSTSGKSSYREETSSPSGRKYQNTNRRSNSGFRKNKDYGGHDKEKEREREREKEKEESYSRRSHKPKIQSSSTDTSSGTSLYKFKLQRPSGRWSYKTTPKPRVTIRRLDSDQNEVATSLTTPQPQYAQPDGEVAANRREDHDDYDDGLKTIRSEPIVTPSTLKVQISTPADFSDVYYEIATIRSPYTFQVGTVKNTRFITVTSTLEKTLQPIEPTLPVIPNKLTEPLTENILATTPAYDKDNNLDSSIATLPPIALGTDVETPPLETITEAFSTTQMLLKTHILPVIRGGNDTTSYTLVQSYQVTRLVTATKTLPPMEVYQFVPSKTLNEFNTRLEEAGSELHLELDFGDAGNEEDDDEHPSAIRAFPPDLDLANVGNDFDVSSVDSGKFNEALRQGKPVKTTAKTTTTEKPPTTTPAISPEQVQQLALLRFLNPGANIPQFITSSKPVIKLETVYESHLIPLFNGISTSYSTISRPIATVSKTEYEVVTSTITNPLPPVPVNPLNPLFPPAPQFSLTSTPIYTSTMVTATESKVLKLTFGAKTAYTTLFSTRVIPTVLTTYLTTNVPVVPTAFPGFFPSPFGGFPGYVG